MLDELESNQKEYEVSFLVAEEGDAAEVENVLSKNQATIVTKGPVVMMKLSYPIKKHASAYFGFMHFKTLPEVAATLRQALHISKKIIRFLIVTPWITIQSRESRDARMISRERPVASAISPVTMDRQVSSRQEIKPEASKVLSNEGLEKELEEILK